MTAFKNPLRVLFLTLPILALLGVTLSGCQDPQSTNADSPMLTSGIDTAGGNAEFRPQDDFNIAVNGGWIESTEIPGDRSNYGSFSILDEQSDRDVSELILEVAGKQQVEQGSAEQKLRDFYNAFMDVETVNGKGLQPIQPELDYIDGLASHDDLIDAFGKLGIYGVGVPFGLYIYSDLKDPDTNILYLTQWGLSLPNRDYYLNDDAQFVEGRELLKTYATALFSQLGEDNPEAIADQILALESKLAEHQWDKQRLRDPEETYNPLSHEALAALFGRLDLNRYLSASEVPAQPRYILNQPSYIEALRDLVFEIPLEQWKPYLKLQVIDRFAYALPDEIYSASFNFHSKGLSGIEEPRSRSKRAVDLLNKVLGQEVGKLYVARHFAPESKQRMATLVDNLFAAYKQSISELEWMSEQTKAAALDKLAKFNVKIGYPDQWKDYSKLDIVPGDLMTNSRNAARFEHEEQLAKLGKPVDKSEWGITPQTVNAYYRPSWNEIVFPAAILQPPFFNPEAEDAVNYGAIGAVIGHEIGHGFDDKGRKYDGDGNLRDWWSPEDAARFELRRAKLAAQFDAYEVIPGHFINGDFTSGENIGDLGGVSIAHLAYQISRQGTTPPVIDGLTADQRFFMGWAQIWRRLYREEELIKRLNTDTHSPSEARINQILKNIPAFHEAFDVQPEDGMWLEPDARVKIW